MTVPAFLTMTGVKPSRLPFKHSCTHPQCSRPSRNGSSRCGALQYSQVATTSTSLRCERSECLLKRSRSIKRAKPSGPLAGFNDKGLMKTGSISAYTVGIDDRAVSYSLLWKWFKVPVACDMTDAKESDDGFLDSC